MISVIPLGTSYTIKSIQHVGESMPQYAVGLWACALSACCYYLQTADTSAVAVQCSAWVRPSNVWFAGLLTRPLFFLCWLNDNHGFDPCSAWGRALKYSKNLWVRVCGWKFRLPRDDYSRYGTATPLKWSKSLNGSHSNWLCAGR